MATEIELREINKLIKERFYLPTSQRGYRWDTQQVEDLLNDVYEFKEKANTQNGEFYCLQPIVVTKRDDGRYDVIDGQQRLTTIMIIQKFLNKRTYTIEYATRDGSSDFLENIKEYVESDDDLQESSKNIDFFFMSNAYLTVKKWFEETEEANDEFSLQDEFSTYLLKYCKVIWYEVDDGSKAESIFTRLNIGKIPLTNAELIKALFLKKSNYDSLQDPSYLRQLEIANEWDTIENTLQNDKVWYFINPSYRTSLDTRIEYIFDVIADKSSRDGENFTFYAFAERMENDSIFTIWKEIKDYFRIIMEWYGDQKLYHLIGFLTSSSNEITIRQLIHEYYTHQYKKDEFLDYIKELISEHFSTVDLADLSYEYSSDQTDIRDVLLLFNVITVMNKSNAYSRFPFDSYNMNAWSLEHIHAQNAEGIGNKKELWLAWIDEHLASFKQFTDEKYKEVVTMLENVDRENITGDIFNTLFTDISTMIQDDYGVDLHNIDNLALLDIGSNSSISNNFFDVKRRMIIDMDRNGDFIPVCTRNVFLKYYSKDTRQIHYWSESDRQDYLDAIKKTISEYLPAEEAEGNE